MLLRLESLLDLSVKWQNYPANYEISLLLNPFNFSVFFSKRKINDFLTILEGFDKATEITAMFKDHASSFR